MLYNINIVLHFKFKEEFTIKHTKRILLCILLTVAFLFNSFASTSFFNLMPSINNNTVVAYAKTAGGFHSGSFSSGSSHSSGSFSSGSFSKSSSSSGKSSSWFGGGSSSYSSSSTRHSYIPIPIPFFHSSYYGGYSSGISFFKIICFIVLIIIILRLLRRMRR